MVEGGLTNAAESPHAKKVLPLLTTLAFAHINW